MPHEPSIGQGSLVNDRYRICELIGQGGAGTVYRVLDQLNEGTERALKTLRRDTPYSPDLNQFKQEFRILSTLSHPSIAQVHDFGLVELTGQPLFFFISDLVRGKHLNDAARQTGREEILDWMVQICEAVDFLAVQGLVHRDLKSSNVLVTPEGGRNRVKILDFGIAVDMLKNATHQMMGTIPYMAPELLRGEIIDSRADLYSVGVMYYYLCVGHLPFQGTSVSEMVHQHETQEIIPPRQFDSTIPAALEQIILKLLAKDQSNRFYSGKQVIEELEAVREQLQSLQPTQSGAIPSPSHAAPRVLTPKFLGRDREIKQLQSFSKEIFSGAALQSSACLIIGESGAGKSALLSTFKHLLQLEQIRVITLAIGSLRPGMESFKPLIKEILSLFEINLRSQFTHRLSRFWPEFSDLKPDQKLPEDKSSGFILEDLLIEIILAAARMPMPTEVLGLALLVDDLHQLSPDGLRFFHALSHAVRNREQRLPLLIIGTFNLDQPAVMHTPQGEPPITLDILKIKQDLIESDIFLKIPLHPFSVHAISDFLESLSGIKFNQSTLPGEIHRLTGGNIFFVQEIARALLDQPGGDEPTAVAFEEAIKHVRIPKNIHDILSARKEGLTGDEIKLIRLLSVFGESCTPGTLRRLKDIFSTMKPDLFPDDVLSTLDLLISKGLLRRGFSDGNIYYEFEHHLMLQNIYRSISDREREQYHAVIAQGLEDAGLTVNDLCRIADHYLETSNCEKSLIYALDAARESQRRSDLETAIYYYEKALPLADKPTQLQIHDDTAHLCMIHGDLQRAERHYLAMEQTLITAAGQTGELIKVLRKSAELYLLMLQPTKALDALDRGNALEMCTGDALEGLKMLWIRGRIRFRLGQFQEMLDEAERGIEEAGRLGAREELAEFLYNRGLGRNALGFFHGAVTDVSQSIDVFTELGMNRRMAFSLNGLGYVYHHQNLLDDALNCYLRAYEIAGHIGENRYLINFATNIATIYHSRQEFSKAQNYYEQALAAAERVQHEGEKAKILRNLGNLFHVYGHFIRAERLLQHGLKISLRMKMPDEEAIIHLFLGDLNLEKEDWNSARGHFLKALEYYRQSGVERDQINALHGLAVSYIGTNEMEKADALLAEAGTLCERSDFTKVRLSHSQHRVEFWLEKVNRWAADENEKAVWKDSAEHYMIQALEFSEKEQDPRLLWSLWILQGELFQDLGDQKKAIANFQRAQRLIDEFGKHIPTEYRHYFFATTKIARLRKTLELVRPDTAPAEERETSVSVQYETRNYNETGKEGSPLAEKEMIHLVNGLEHPGANADAWIRDCLRLLGQLSGFQSVGLFAKGAEGWGIEGSWKWQPCEFHFSPTLADWAQDHRRDVMSFDNDLPAEARIFLQNESTGQTAWRIWFPLPLNLSGSGVIFLEGNPGTNLSPQHLREKIGPIVRILALGLAYFHRNAEG